MTCAAPQPDSGHLPSREAVLSRLPGQLLLAGMPEPEVFTGTVHAAGLAIRLAGIQSHVDGETVTGSAGSLVDDPFSRAVFEVVERMALLEASRRIQSTTPVFDAARRGLGVVSAARAFPKNAAASTWRWSRSNGVAAGRTWEDAARRARLELIERDRVLRSWFGERAPVPIEDLAGIVPSALNAEYDVAAYSFADVGDTVSVAGVFGFPRSRRPFVYGFGARETLAGALTVAAGELVQRLGFLWDEELPEAPPAPTPTADFHQEHYLFAGHHAKLRSWLAGEHTRFSGLLAPNVSPEEPVYVDLSPENGPFVVKALPIGHVPLVFGLGHPSVLGKVPEPLAVHPIA